MGKILDIALGSALSLFLVSAGFVEVPHCLGFAPASLTVAWCEIADPLFLKNPYWLRNATCIHGIFFGVCYLLLAIANFLHLDSMSVRFFGVATMSAKLYAGTLYMWSNLGDPETPPVQPWLFVLQSSLYMIVPFTLVMKYALFSGRSESTSSNNSNKKKQK